MSDKFTEVETASGGGLGLWGHVPPDEALAQFRAYCERSRAEAEQALADLDAGKVEVYHQMGPLACRDRHLAGP